MRCNEDVVNLLAAVKPRGSCIPPVRKQWGSPYSTSLKYIAGITLGTSTSFSAGKWGSSFGDSTSTYFKQTAALVQEMIEAEQLAPCLSLLACENAEDKKCTQGTG